MFQEYLAVSTCGWGNCIPASHVPPPNSLLSSPLERVSTGGTPRSISLLRTAGNICSWEGDKKGSATPPCHTFHTTSVPVCFLLQQTITKPSHRTIDLCVCLLRLCRTLPDDGMTQTWLNICQDIYNVCMTILNRKLSLWISAFGLSSLLPLFHVCGMWTVWF